MGTRRSAVGRKSTVLGRKLGGELLQLREGKKLTQPQAASHLTATQTKIVKIEQGVVPVRDPDLHALCDLYGVGRKSPVRDRLLALAKADRERRRASGWWKEYTDLGDLVEYIQLEAGASDIRTYQNQLIPGLLQTPKYARAVTVAHGAWEDPDEIDQFVAARLTRQARLTDETPLELWAILSEAALRQQVGGEATMNEQLGHLLDVGSQSNVKLQVLPYKAGAHAAMSGPFVLMSFPAPTAIDVVYLETVSSSQWLEGAEDADRHTRLFDNLRRTALSPEDSRVLISDVHKETR